jgi:hypothetical protein
MLREGKQPVTVVGGVRIGGRDYVEGHCDWCGKVDGEILEEGQDGFERLQETHNWVSLDVNAQRTYHFCCRRCRHEFKNAKEYD